MEMGDKLNRIAFYYINEYMGIVFLYYDVVLFCCS